MEWSPKRRRRLLLSILFCTFLSSQSHIADHSKIDKNENNTEVPYLLTDVEMRCPEGWENEGAKCYKLYQSERSWPQALIFCNRYGASLARIESQRENLFVSRMLTRPQRASTWAHSAQWIGLISQQGASDSTMFMWSDGSAVSRYVGFWAPSQPNYSTGSCTSASLDKHSELEWRLDMCNQLLPFVCELPACVSGSFFCQNGKCVAENAHCNGINECGDFSDELNCPVAHSSENCMKYERGENGRIETPNFPSSYRSNLNCRWVIEGPVNSRITLSFDVFETEQNQDLVTILDGGPAENSTLVLETLSGTPKSSQLTLTSSTNMMIVRFRSDSSIQARGFKANWIANNFACGGVLKAQAFSQSFSSPRLYSGAECAWRIEASQGQLISLNIDSFEIDENKDFLIIYDGSQPSSPVLTKLTGKIENQLVISTQSHLYLYFYSNYAHSAKGFTISYKKGCDNTVHYTHGTLFSPGNAILPYPASQKCKYTIELPESKQGQPIALAVNKFDVLPDDYLKIYEDDKLEKPLHEGQGFNEVQRPPKHIYAKQSKVVLVFETNALKSGHCPILNTPPSVYLSTQNTALGTKVGVTCKTGHEFANGIGQRFDVTCELSGKWSVDTIPNCQPIYCSAVPQIANGIAVSATNVTFGGIAKYRCHDGFIFASGKEVEEISCKEDGWSQVPKCRAESCPALPQFLNGKRILRFGDGNGFGTVYEFKCDTGYKQFGSPTILCKSDGRWSSEQPSCKKLQCPNIPQIKNGKIVVTGGRLNFGDAARVECSAGYRSTGADIIHCLANQTLSRVPECRDLDECVEELASCSGKSTECVNLDGGYTCKCLNGFRPQMNCPSFLPLLPVKVKMSSSQISNLSNLIYCADSTDSQRVVTFTFAAPKILERIRFEKVGNGMPEVVSIEYANDTNGHFLSNANLSRIEMKNMDMAGSQVVVLHSPIEAQMIRITIHEYKQSPCTKIELMGCQKSSCTDENECEAENGNCDHLCHNSQSSYKCSCFEGFDLFKMDGQSGMFLKDGETGYGKLDSIRFNKTCIPRRCAKITAPENGKIVSQLKGDFQFPTVVEFQCKFGYQMHGSRYLKCTSDGKWNGTVPTCTPAVCEGIQNNSAIGMFVSPSLPFVSYGGNVTISCTQQNRPARVSPLGGIRQCIYDPHTNTSDYWLSGPDADCPLVHCGPPPVIPGVFYEGDDSDSNFNVGASFGFSCRPPYSLIGKSSYDDRIVRCNVDGSWDLGDLRCEGPLCVDLGHPDDGRTFLESVEEGSVAKFKCNRPGYKPFPSDSINCTLGMPCLLSEDVGISSGFIPDGAFSDSDTKTIWGYEPHRSRLSSTGWCGSKDAFIFLSVDLQRIYTLTTLRLAGVAGSGHLKGHVTKLQLFYKLQFSQNYDSYPIEFETAPGNHNKMYQFTLHPPVRARYILLGVTEYEDNPCLRFDLEGCLAPLSLAHEIPHHLQVGWNDTVPKCLDAEPPVFKNCPANPIYAQIDESGQLLPVSFDVPIASDNSGFVAYTKVEPKDFQPPYPIHEPLDVKYKAFDEAGNTAECVVQLRVPDTQPPAMKCPESYVLPAELKETERHVQFNESTVAVVIHDTSNITEMKIQPTEATLRLNSHVEVEVTATDSHSNQNTCKFQVALMPEPCSESSLIVDENSVTRSCSKQSKGTVCTVKCKEGYRFVNNSASNPTELQYTCTEKNEWSPNLYPPSCVAIVQEPARYELHVSIDYTSNVAPGDECMKAYAQTVTSYFDQIGQTLTQRCSSSVQVFVRLLNVEFHADFENPQHIRANYTVQVLPTVFQDVFYELCSLTLRTIFDLRIPGATVPIKQLLSLPSGVLAGPASCPAMNATDTSFTQGFSCSNGETLRMSEDKEELPECIPCPKGTAFVNNACVACPEGSYQNKEGELACKSCPDGTFTQDKGAQSKSQCLAVCGNGLYSQNGLIPCQLCPRNTYAGPPAPAGFKSCEPCPENTFTANLGATGPSQCKKPCKPGHFSATGLEPCSPCPINFYQPNPGQQRCVECNKDAVTHESGRDLEKECKALDCAGVKCQNKGTCAIENHQIVCQCRPGYRGKFCEEIVPLCDSQPCLNGGTCEPHQGSFRCICNQNYTGRICQFGPDECIGVTCPNGGVCHDLPGLNSTKCLCRVGWAGPDCTQVANPCQQTPCRNGADCIPLQLGRYKCRCLPGWQGANCEQNIDDCKSNPCALGAVCHDLINDFECECPRGFSGKRCSVKEDLCSPNPCVNGTCVDTLFDRKCVCSPGWTGSLCDKNIDECSSNPCKNGGTCRDQENGYICQCTPGYYGINCQNQFDHCAASPCHNNATCLNKGDSYKCECRLGYDGVHCEINRDDCSPSKCNVEGTDLCEDLVNDFKCHCRTGYTGSLCDTHLDQCASDPCKNNGVCVDQGSSFTCNCPKGWKGRLCEEESGKCLEKPCQNGGNCIQLQNDEYFCVCPDGVSGKHCENAPNRCLGEPCINGVCGDFGNRMECNCNKNFVGDGCQYKLDACNSNVCKNGATCIQEKLGNFKCICAPGYTGSDCSVEINECIPSPCPMTATCVDQVNAYYCRCPFNMTGAACDKRIDPDYDLRFNDGIIGAKAALAVPFHFASGALSLSLWVRFDNAHSKGNVLTLYHSQNANTPSNLTELLRISAESVRLALFPEDTPLTLHFPPSQKLNDGNWNSLILTWSAHEGTYSLIWNAVRLYSDVGYAKNKQLDINAWISLGGQPVDDDSEAEPKFVGSLTRVNLWSRILDFESDIPSIVQKCQDAPILYNGLVLQFANYDRLHGNVEKIVRSTCGRSQATGLQHQPTREQRAAEAVQVEECPSDIFLVTPNKEVNVSWKEPMFSSANPIDRIEKNLKPGQVFTFGEFMVLYVAYDNESNVAECSFKIHISRQFCEDIPNPSHGIQTCEHWGPDLKYRACSIQCEDGYEFSEKPAIFYTCAGDGVWRPRPENSVGFRYPQCSKKSPAERMIHIQVHYPTVTICNQASRTILSDRLLQRIHQLNHKWKLCSQTAPEDLCKGAQVTVNCMSEGDDANSILTKRHKRQDTSQQMFSVQVDVPVKRASEMKPFEGKQMDPMDIIQTEVLLKDFLNLEQVLPNGRPDLNSFKIDNEFKCKQGEVNVGDDCVPCAAGSFFNEKLQKCELCSSGNYQPSQGKSTCLPCAQNGVTLGPGATSVDECKTRCNAGHFLNNQNGECEPCGYGFYQPQDGSFSCLPCGIGKTTLEKTSTLEEQCRDECGDGEQLTESGHCEPCQVGFYRTKGVHKLCQECMAGTTTEGTKSVKRSDCNTPRCIPGQFLVISSRQCQFCPRATYQDKSQQSTCIACPVDHTTASAGATHESQCYSTNQCTTGENNCSWHAVCLDLPDDNDVPSFECKCKSGFRGNGTHCTDACNNFCLNDGVCKKNQIGFVECQCKESFSGERCEIRFQPRTQKIAFITAGIGGVVVLLIIIVIVIWMIGYRYNRPDRISTLMDKPGGISNFDSPLHSNFIYGRGAAERSASSLGRHESAARPVGFYYEDETPYECSEAKTMFVGAGGSNTEEEMGESSGADDSQRSETANLHQLARSNRDSSTLDQRLHQMRQNIYQSKFT